MPVGTGAVTTRLLPSQEYKTDPAQFNALTKHTESQQPSFARVGAGETWAKAYPQAGIVSKSYLVFEGTITVVPGTGSIDTTARYPYGLINDLKVAANNGLDIMRCDGLDLHALRFVRWPSYGESTDQHPGVVGANTGLASGDVHLTWELPYAIDDVTLGGSLYLQSQSTEISIDVREALDAELFVVNGNATVTLTGTWTIHSTIWEVPYGTGEDAAKVIIPDLSRLHLLIRSELAVNNVGRNRLELPKSDGQLSRLFASADSNSVTRTPLQFRPGAPAANAIDAIRLTYGNNRTPLDFDPAGILSSRNNEHYGGQLPYNRVVLDQIRTHPVRDAILLEGLTELSVELDVNAAVVLTQAKARFVEEILTA